MEASVAVVAEELKAMEIANDKKPVVVGDDGGEAKNAATADIAATAAESQKKTKKMNKNRIHVSNSKRPFLFYCNLAKRYIKQYNSVELFALGMAIPTVITIAETLKRNGLAVEKKISTCTIVSKLVDVENGRIVLKAQIAILLEKAENIEETAVAAA
ncbi:PREDICTED: At2g34160 [Prunus dulcis]|uniref:PREDICTED: At2g34160 n=2 Tax=Prunus dulcis TaxID=3755 RepID=A0A5E4G396_PRUDU|nr:uncharacterized protein At2g34160-like [Prunus dulcis]VVA34140.1 PREDICTED: At2g34160 [Prunus dulcis]